MKVLYVSRYIYPNQGGSVSITENLVRHFGADEMVLLGSRRLFGRRHKRSDPFNFPRVYYQTGEINVKGKGDRFFEPIRYLLFPFLVLKIIHVYRSENCDRILANFPDIFFCYASYLASKILDCPFSTYFHNTYLENRPKGHRRYFALRWQPKIFMASQKIFVMSDGLRDYYRKKYGDRDFITLPHTHNYAYDSTFSKTASLRDSIKVLLIGNFNDSNVDATRRIIDALKDIEGITFSFYTHVPKILLNKRGIDTDVIDLKGFLPERDLFNTFKEYDIALLTHGFHGGYSEVEYETIFPTRTIPFLVSGIPLFAYAPLNSFLARFIKAYDCAFICSAVESQMVRDEFVRFLNQPEDQLIKIKNAYMAAEIFDGSTVAAKLKDSL